jgi:hypothetical protein
VEIYNCGNGSAECWSMSIKIGVVACIPAPASLTNGLQPSVPIANRRHALPTDEYNM